MILKRRAQLSIATQWRLKKLVLFCLLVSSFSCLISEASNEENSEENDGLDSVKIDPKKEALKRPERLTVVAPRFLRPQSDYHVLVYLANSASPVSIDLQLTGARDSNREQSEAKSVLAQSGETQTVKFSIGDWPDAEYTLNVTAQAVDRSWNFTKEASLLYQSKSLSILIQTDKAIYKSGELVQFRAIFLTQALMPLALKEEINISIEDADKNLIKQWIGLSSPRGLVSLNLPLSEDPVLGDWTIKVESRKQVATKQFQVAEYVLPTFDVQIQLPSYAIYNKSDIVATVRATYTYGKPVNGHIVLTVQPLDRFRWIDTRPLQQVQYRSRLVNGSANFEMNLVKNVLQDHDNYEREVEFFALVEEDLTGRKYNKTEILKIYRDDIKVEVVNSDATFKPGLNYTNLVKVAYVDDTPVEDGGAELELEYTFSETKLGTAKIRPVNGLVEHTIRVPRNVTVSDELDEFMQVPPYIISIQAKYKGLKYYLPSIYAFNSDSKQHMQIVLRQLESSVRQKRSRRLNIPSLRSISVNDFLKVLVRSTEPMQQVTCQGMARGDIVWAVSKDARNLTEFEFEVKVEQKMAPETRILCFYIRDQNKEIIADAVKLTVTGMAKNLVKLSTSREEAKPGQVVEVDVLTKPNSLVGVLGLDQSVLLLKSGNDISMSELSKEMNSYGVSDQEYNFFGARNAEGLFNTADVVVLTNNLVYDGFGTRVGRLLGGGWMNIRYATASRFSSSIALETVQSAPAAPMPGSSMKKSKIEPQLIRTFFPETWMWENGTAGEDGIAQFKAKVPDTITSWVLSAFSLSDSAGFGLSTSKTSVRVFRPFFIKLNLPYSIMRGETLSIQAVIFNYSKRPVQAKVTLESRDGEFQFVKASNELEDEETSGETSETRTVRIPAEDGASASFLITPKKLGYIDIRVTAVGDQAVDAVVRKLLVKPEGQTQYMNNAMLINLDGKDKKKFTRNISVEIPPNAVPGSSKVSVSAIGDILGSGLSNVDDLLRIPYGCGEQNMINLVPNIVILNYLKRSQRLKEPQRSKAIKNIETGYQRQLKYKRSDGSFSAFGESDDKGSVWLTAYVLKSFQQAKDFVSIDETVISDAAEFIAKFSRPDGSIEEVGMLHNKALQSESKSPVYLTAYSLIALLQRPIKLKASMSKFEKPDLTEESSSEGLKKVIERGLDFLERKLDDAAANDSPYELAIIAYALALGNRAKTADRAHEKLWVRAREERDQIWWENSLIADREKSKESENLLKGTSTVPPLKPRVVNTKHSAHLFLPDSLAVEMSSLALLGSVRRGELDRAHPIVRWLIGQQNSNGGFASTQDTVLAIEGLASFAAANAASNTKTAMEIEMTYPRPVNTSSSSVSFRRPELVDSIQIEEQNTLVNHKTQLPENVSWVQIDVSGEGAAVVQVSWQYNLLVSAEQPAFYLNPILDKSSTLNYLQLSVCTYYKAGETSNMALMEVDLPSGYEADVEALPGLTRTDGVKRVDTTDSNSKVLIYIEKLGKEELCVTVPAHRTSKVSNNKPVPVTIYDYYDRHQAARIFYEPEQATSCDICEQDTCSKSCANKRSKRSAISNMSNVVEPESVKEYKSDFHTNLHNSTIRNRVPYVLYVLSIFLYLKVFILI